MEDDHIDITDIATDKFRHIPSDLLGAWYEGLQARMQRNLDEIERLKRTSCASPPVVKLPKK